MRFHGRILATASIMLLTASPCVAQEPEVDAKIEAVDDNAITILERYAELRPDLYQSLQIRSWRPHATLFLLKPIGVEHHLWEQAAIAPSIRVSAPTFTDRNSITLRIGDQSHATITFSNGSAFNHMAWPNDPGAYRDARTLSFPIPR